MHIETSRHESVHVALLRALALKNIDMVPIELQWFLTTLSKEQRENNEPCTMFICSSFLVCIKIECNLCTIPYKAKRTQREREKDMKSLVTMKTSYIQNISTSFHPLGSLIYLWYILRFFFSVECIYERTI